MDLNQTRTILTDGLLNMLNFGEGGEGGAVQAVNAWTVLRHGK